MEIKPSKDIDENKVIAAIGYIWILCLVPLFLKRNSSFAQFHAKQGLVLFIAEIVGMLLYWIPLVGQILFVILIILSVIGIVKALGGQEWELPILGRYAKKINL